MLRFKQTKYLNPSTLLQNLRHGPHNTMKAVNNVMLQGTPQKDVHQVDDVETCSNKLLFENLKLVQPRIVGLYDMEVQNITVVSQPCTLIHNITQVMS